MEEQELAALHEALIDDHTLAALFADLAAHTEVLGVRLKTGAVRRTSPGSVSLGDAQTALMDGSLRSAQIHYLYSGSQWRDTIIRASGGWKIVRIDHSRALGPIA